MIPPVPRRIPHSITQLGRVRHDEYAWMKDENWQKVLRDPSLLRTDIAEALREENTYTEHCLAEMAPLRETLLKEMIGRVPPAEDSVPWPDGDWLYFSRFAKDAQHPVYLRRPRAGGDEQVLLDVEALAKEHAYFALAGTRHSDDHRIFVYAADTQARKSIASTASTSKQVKPMPQPSRVRRAALSSRRIISGCSGSIVTITVARHGSIAARSPVVRMCWYSTRRIRASSSA